MRDFPANHVWWQGRGCSLKSPDRRRKLIRWVDRGVRWPIFQPCGYHSPIMGWSNPVNYWAYGRKYYFYQLKKTKIGCGVYLFGGCCTRVTIKQVLHSGGTTLQFIIGNHHAEKKNWALVTSDVVESQVAKSAKSMSCSSWYGDGSKPWYLVNPKIAGKWMFIPIHSLTNCIYRYWSIAICQLLLLVFVAGKIPMIVFAISSIFVLAKSPSFFPEDPTAWRKKLHLAVKLVQINLMVKEMPIIVLEIIEQGCSHPRYTMIQGDIFFSGKFHRNIRYLFMYNYV